ncbi:MAG TPA: hypothetical protein VIN56_01715 [Candidatus Dormibacteraeota bacterium]|jgi:hypothetical protein
MATPDYFAEVCEEALGRWFTDRGFWLMEQYCSATMVSFRRRAVFMRFWCSGEDAPRYPVMIGLGEVKDGFGLVGLRKPMLHGLGLWEVVEHEADREVLRRTFRTRAELERLMESVRDRALPHAEPFFEDRDRLRRAVRRRVKA